MRTYRVLVENEDGSYRIVGDIQASSAEQAIRLAATEHGDGRYVAVPDRSWNESGAKREVRIVLTDPLADTGSDNDDEPEDEPEAENDDAKDAQGTLPSDNDD